MKISTIAAGCVALMLTCNPAVSADLEPEAAAAPPPAGGWEFNVTTYGWLPWISGDIGVRGRSFGIDVDPNTILHALDWGSGLPAWFSYVEARNGPVSFFNDIVYSKLSGSGDFATTGPGGALSLSGDVKADYQQTIIELGGTYEVWADGEQGTNRAAFDLLAGGRYWKQDVSVSADLSANLNIDGLEVRNGRVYARSGSVDWTDPFVGARLRKEILPGQSLMVRGDIGGFGVGSEFSWQVIAAYDVHLAAINGVGIDGYLGYRALSVDYSQGSGKSRYEMDALMHGPVMGVTFRF